MNEKEKKAIEELSKKAIICNYEERDYPNMICFKKDMIIALNLIEKLQKENEELKADNYELNNRITDLLENIPIQKVKDKIKEEKMPLTIAGGIRNKKTLEYGISLGRMQVLQELIEEREEK